MSTFSKVSSILILRYSIPKKNEFLKISNESELRSVPRSKSKEGYLVFVIIEYFVSFSD